MEISVVIPLYNKAPYISRAIQSVLSQTLPAAEIIVVDDGSSDGSSRLVEREFGSTVKLIYQENSGEAAARNRGIEVSDYPWIGFLDGDDEWKPDFLAQINSLKANFPNCGLYATSAQTLKPDGQISFPNLSILPAEPWMGIIPNFFELFQNGYAFNSSSVVVSKNVLIEVGCFPSGVKEMVDIACWVNIAMRYPIAFSTSKSVIYHQDAENRLGNEFTLRKEMYFNQIIRNALDHGEMPVELRAEAFEFMTQKQIFVATHNIMAGDPAYARHLLSTCKGTKRYKRDWLWWRFWASLPPGWPEIFLRVKQFVFMQGAR